MSGVKGKSGGARPNSGPKPKPPALSSVKGDDSETFLASLVKDTSIDLRLRLDAAKALLTHSRQSADKKGKKEVKQERAEQVSKGSKFAPAPPPAAVRH